MQSLHVYIIIVNYKQWQDTIDCVESILLSDYDQYSIIVVDNNSPNDSIKNLIEWAGKNQDRMSSRHFSAPACTGSGELNSVSKLTIIQNDKNAGFAAANNLVLSKLADTDSYVLLLNPDMIATPELLSALINYAGQQPVDAIIGATIRHWPGNHELLFYCGGNVNWNSATIRPARKTSRIEDLDYISGACLFTHASSFKKFGLLPEEYFLYWEETDWCFNAKKNGAVLKVCENAVCYDKISTVIGRGFLSDYYYSRNGLLFVSKSGKGNVALAIAGNGIRILKRLVSGQWSRANGIYRGTVDFLKKRFHALQ